VTTPSASSPYISREEAAGLFSGTADHIYQGDIFQSLELVVPRMGGMLDPVVSHAIVISHDCEYTKVAHAPSKPLLVAPLRELRVFAQRQEIVDGQAHALWALPNQAPVDDEFAVDFRLIQPIAVSELKEAALWTCLSPDLKDVMHARLARFLLRLDLKS
jgi:hypothetical protein